jgi:hypothetical protein
MTDLRYALRMLLKSPGFSIIAIATLALGIGANTAIFSVVESSLLRPLPFPEADRLVRLYELSGETGEHSTKLNLAPTTLRQWREHGGDIFTGIGAGTGASLTLGASAGEPAENIPAALITANFLEIVGLPPMLGRNFATAEDQPGTGRVVIVGYDFWRQHLGGRTDGIGKSVTLDGCPYRDWRDAETFRHPYHAQVGCLCGWIIPLKDQRHNFCMVARLRPGISVPQAEAATNRLCVRSNRLRLIRQSGSKPR